MPIKCPCKVGWPKEKCLWAGSQSKIEGQEKPDGVRFWIQSDAGHGWDGLVCEAAGEVILRAQPGTMELTLKLFRLWAGHD